MSSTPIKTPCVKVCAIHGKTGWCLGCGRSLHEVSHWVKFSDNERDAILAELPQRKVDLKKRLTANGGRA